MIDRHFVMIALDAVESLRTELEKGLQGGIVAPHYLSEKIETLALNTRLMGSMPDKVRPRQKGDRL